MHTAASVSAGGGATVDAGGFNCGRKYITTKRRSSGNFFDEKASSENGRSKLGFFESGITASPIKGKNISLISASPSGSGICDSGVLGSPFESLQKLKPDCSSGKKKVNRGLGLRANGEGDDELGLKKRTPGRRKDFVKKNCNTDGNPGSKLLMGNVTILKRGEKIEDVVVANRSSDGEEGRRGVLRVKADSEFNSGRGIFVREEKKGLEQCVSSGRGLPAKKPMKKAKAAARASQVCPVVLFSDVNSKDVEIDKSQNGGKDEILKRLGPDPSVLSKELASGKLKCVSLGNRLSDASSDDDVMGAFETGKGSFGTDGNVKSPSTPLGIPRVTTPDNFGGQTPEPVEHPNGGFMFEKWAGPAYANSPSPRCLPLPKFFIRHKVRPSTQEEAIDIKRFEIPQSPNRDNDMHAALPVERSNASLFSHGGFDVFATWNLRRLLQLE